MARWNVRRAGIALTFANVRARTFGERFVVVSDVRKLVLLELFEIQQRDVSAGGAADELIQLHLDRLRIAVLRVLDEEHHEKGDDRRSRIDDELPCIAEVKKRPR